MALWAPKKLRFGTPICFVFGIICLILEKFVSMCFYCDFGTSVLKSKDIWVDPKILIIKHFLDTSIQLGLRGLITLVYFTVGFWVPKQGIFGTISTMPIFEHMRFDLFFC